ncbi:ATP-dependent nuclease [Jiangella asiatica]|uniref:ATP-dependent nuclease n=1 Tax=Jiangella asiatica TaxID=2530372 RepID=UPI0013A5D1C8|nr:AAA family ATPase [Jiangella asiatica]
MTVKNLRSIGQGGVAIDLPRSGPLVLLGENNAGKSNIVKSIEILFGERWPKSHKVEEHDFFGRDPDGISISIGASLSAVRCDCGGTVAYLKWEYSTSTDGDPYLYKKRCDHCTNSYPSNKLRQQLFAMIIGADRRLSQQLSYYSQYTLLSRLMHRFHERLTSDPVRREALKTIFLSLLEQFKGVPEFDDFSKLLSETSEELGQSLPYRLDVDFSAYDPSNFFRSLRVYPSLDGEIKSFDELGTGQEQILALAFSIAYAKAFGDYEGLILVVEEPESHLHPLAQMWLAAKLGDIADSGLQVIVTTHSPHFVDLSKPENLVIVSKPDAGTTRTVQTSRDDLVEHLIGKGSDPARTTSESIGEFYSSSATTQIKSALFSRLCVLVEGPSEELSFPTLLGLVGFDALREGVAFVSAEGIASIARWVRLFDAFQVPTYCIFDTDSDKSGKDAQSAQASRQDIFRSLSLDPTYAQSAALSNEPLHVESSYATLDANFEDAMAKLLGDVWSSAYFEAFEVIGASKPLRARYAAKLVNERTSNLDGPGGQAIGRLATALRQKLGGTISLPGGARDVGKGIVDVPRDLEEPPF